MSSPVLGYKVKHGRSGLPLELERLEAGEAETEAARRGGVARGDGHVLTGQRVDPVPAPAHERDGGAVAGVVHVPTQHALQGDVRNLAAGRRTGKLCPIHGELSRNS